MLKSVTAIRHIEFEDLGFFEEPLRRAGYAIDYLDAAEADPVALECRDADLVVVLGGPMGVYEADRYPFIRAELRMIEKRIAAGKPILGICLGSQLIAQAMGARIYRGSGKEIGFAPVQLTATGRLSPLRAIAADQPVLHWHGDTFDLPAGAELLASTTAYANQAFSAGANLLALQFHLEAGDGIERWLSGHAKEIRAAGIDPETLRTGAGRNAAALRTVANDMLASWLSELEAGKPSPAPALMG